MHFIPNMLKLYAVTDRSWLDHHTLESQVEQAILGGVSIVQLREKELSQEAFLAQALSLKKITSQYNIPLIINDHVQIAHLSGADGVHLGQKDAAVKEARALLGPHAIIGVSARTPELALKAEKEGADYLGVGAIFGTTTKKDAQPLSYEVLKTICSSTKLPVVAIGGIDASNIPSLQGSGIAGVAVVSSLFKSSSIIEQAKILRLLSEQVVSL